MGVSAAAEADSAPKVTKRRHIMKIFVVLAVSIVLVSILFCPTVMVAFTMPDDAQIVQPDPSLPK